MNSPLVLRHQVSISLFYFLFFNFSNIAFIFITYAGENSNGLFIKDKVTIDHDVEHLPILK